MIRGPQDFDRIIPSIEWAMAVELAVHRCDLVPAIARRRARSWSPAAFIVAQMLTMGLMADNALLESLLVDASATCRARSSGWPASRSAR